MGSSIRQRNLWALSGVLFAALFLASLVLGGVLAAGSFPLPGAPATDVTRYFTESRTAVLVSGSFQVLSAASLLAFAPCVASLVRSTENGTGALLGLTLGGGNLAAIFLLASALLGWVLALAAAELGPGLVGTLRSLNFLTGGAAHVASLGLFVGAASIAALGAKALPRWILGLGVVAATLSILSLVSLLWFPATILLPLGRLLSLVWSIALGLVLALGRRRDPDAGL